MAPFPGEPNKGEVTSYDDIFDATKVMLITIDKF
jgi:hypothetical protein